MRFQDPLPLPFMKSSEIDSIYDVIDSLIRSGEVSKNPNGPEVIFINLMFENIHWEIVEIDYLMTLLTVTVPCASLLKSRASVLESCKMHWPGEDWRGL